MEINVRDDRRLVDVWLTNVEKPTLRFGRGLKSIYDRYRKQNYTVAVFESGGRDLCHGTLDLLSHNKRYVVEQKILQEKPQRKRG